MKIETRISEFSDGVAELYLTAVPSTKKSAEQQAEEVFSGISEILQDKKARIFQERVFAIEGDIDVIKSLRSKYYGDLDDGIEPSWLVVTEGISGPVAGVTVHAIIGADSAEILQLDNVPYGRVFKASGIEWLAISGVSYPDEDSVYAPTHTMVEIPENIWNLYLYVMHSVPCNWK